MAGSMQPGAQPIAVGSTATALVTVTTCGVTVRVDGDVDLANGDQLRATLTAVLADHRPRSITVDLSPLAFADGAGRRALRRFVEEAGLAGASVSLIAPDIRAVRLSLEIGGLHFDIGVGEGISAGS
jgi:anti-anti-sigma factor